jgi:hypothetical protein
MYSLFSCLPEQEHRMQPLLQACEVTIGNVWTIAESSGR